MVDDNITVIGVEKLRKKFGVIARDLVDYDVLDKIGNYLTSAIEVRTAAGYTIEGQPFKPYSDRYAAFRAKLGFPTRPDLILTGSMLDALTYVPQVGQEQVKVFFMEGEGRKIGSQEGSGVSNPAKAFYLQQDRPFFGASLDDIEKITDIYNDHVRGLLRG